MDVSLYFKKLVALDLTESADRAFQKIEKMKEPGVIKNLYTEVLMGAFVESIEPNFDENSSTNEIAGSRSKKISKRKPTRTGIKTFDLAKDIGIQGNTSGVQKEPGRSVSDGRTDVCHVSL